LEKEGEEMKEAVFQSEWLRSFKTLFPYCHAFKIPDSPRFASDHLRFAPVRPYDCYVVIEGKFYAFELKWMKTLTGFSIDRVAEHQIEYLKEVEVAGGRGCVAINYRCNLVSEKTVAKLGLTTGKRFNFTYVLRVRSFIALSESCDGKSIPFETMLKTPYAMCIGKMKVKEENVWNVGKLVF
jgi:penicillin-binding protein-related factor A (putative recombinase)